MQWQHFVSSASAVSQYSVCVCVCVCVYVCVYLDLAGSLDVVDGVEGLLHRLPQSHNAVIPQHQNLHIIKSTFKQA